MFMKRLLHFPLIFTTLFKSLSTHSTKTIMKLFGNYVDLFVSVNVVVVVDVFFFTIVHLVTEKGFVRA